MNTDSKIVEMLKENRFIEAVKMVREERKIGLKEASDYVKNVAVQNGLPMPKAGPGAYIVLGLLAAVIIGVATLLFFVNSVPPS